MIIKFLPLMLFITFDSWAVEQLDSQWLKENCPRCVSTADGFFTTPFMDKNLKFGIKRYGKSEKLNSYRIDVIWKGFIDSTGKVTKTNMSFLDEGHKDQAMKNYRQLCSLFTGYQYFSSSIDFSKGDHFSTAHQPSQGKISLTCHISKEDYRIRQGNYISRGMQRLVRWWNSDSRSDADINDSYRGLEREIPESTRPKNYPSSSQRR